jgi:hypothetical protein
VREKLAVHGSQPEADEPLAQEFMDRNRESEGEKQVEIQMTKDRHACRIATLVGSVCSEIWDQRPEQAESSKGSPTYPFD